MAMGLKPEQTGMSELPNPAEPVQAKRQGGRPSLARLESAQKARVALGDGICRECGNGFQPTLPLQLVCGPCRSVAWERWTRQGKRKKATGYMR
jgi:hypothetical protein